MKKNIANFLIALLIINTIILLTGFIGMIFQVGGESKDIGWTNMALAGWVGGVFVSLVGIANAFWTYKEK
jgi:hypothetical protein